MVGVGTNVATLPPTNLYLLDFTPLIDMPSTIPSTPPATNVNESGSS